MRFSHIVVVTVLLYLLSCMQPGNAEQETSGTGKAGSQQSSQELPMTSASSSYRNGSVFTIKSISALPERRHEVLGGRSDFPPNHPSFDLAVIQFKDNGGYLDPQQIDSADDCIRKARSSTSNQNGAVVIIFIHGWHHGAQWARTRSTSASQADGDDHFHAFRLVLESLALREAERYRGTATESAGGRRVVGIYVGWNGDPEDSWICSTPVLTYFTFGNRYDVAESIGSSAQFLEAIRRIIASAKEPVPVSPDQPEKFRPESPLVMIGHSMGALMLQSALLALLEDERTPLIRRQPWGRVGPVEIRGGNHVLSFPDLILSLNSAADSDIAKRTIDALEKQKIAKTASTVGISYSPPLLASVTSTADAATGAIWRIANGFSRKTDGHDESLFTHRFRLRQRQVTCNRREFLDLGQNWHCLRTPEPSAAATPVIPIDLPARERIGAEDVAVPHDRYTIAPLGDDIRSAHLMWVFQVPPSLIKDHNDIFNSRARSLILGLIQISGAVASVAEDWERSFERY
jgi:hypothetical protein